MNDISAPTARPVRPLLSALLVLLDLLFLSLLLVMAAAWLLDPLRIVFGPLNQTIHWGWKPIVAPGVLILVRAALKGATGRQPDTPRGLWETAGFKKVVLALASIFALLAGVEFALDRSDFQAALPPIVFRGQDNAGGVKVEDTQPDPELLYRLKPGTYFQGRLVNSLGFREREVNPQKTPGTRRVICMGDSITGQGLPGYSQYLHERLTNHPPTPQPWEAFHIGVHGYTALQGLRQFQTLGRRLEPDIVTLYFGWNDHWLSAEADRQKMGLEMRPLAGRVFEALRKKRFFQFFIWALSPVQRLARREQGAGRVLRVPPEEYRSVLAAFVKEIRAAGAIPVIITAPRRSLTAGVVGKEYIRSVAEGNALHDQYVEITRAVARTSQADLLDLAAIFAGPECDGYFAPDGIHFDAYAKEDYLANEIGIPQPGLARIAEEIHRKLREIAGRGELTRLPAAPG